MLLLLVACSSVPSDSASDAVAARPAPSITAATIACDDATATWSFTVETDAWTGNGDVRLSADGAYVEVHPLSSISAAADGSNDALALELAVVADWRDVVTGARTAFNCDAPDLAGVLRVRTVDGSAIADCRAFGVTPERWATWDANVACDTLLEAADTGVGR
jgi:hypothetical protein